MCSNEQVLRAGLGSATEVTNITITWRDGSVDHIESLSADAEYVIVQGEGTAFSRRELRP